MKMHRAGNSCNWKSNRNEMFTSVCRRCTEGRANREQTGAGEANFRWRSVVVWLGDAGCGGSRGNVCFSIFL